MVVPYTNSHHIVFLLFMTSYISVKDITEKGSRYRYWYDTWTLPYSFKVCFVILDYILYLTVRDITAKDIGY